MLNVCLFVMERTLGILETGSPSFAIKAALCLCTQDSVLSGGSRAVGGLWGLWSPG